MNPQARLPGLAVHTRSAASVVAAAPDGRKCQPMCYQLIKILMDRRGQSHRDRPAQSHPILLSPSNREAAPPRRTAGREPLCTRRDSCVTAESRGRYRFYISAEITMTAARWSRRINGDARWTAASLTAGTSHKNGWRPLPCAEHEEGRANQATERDVIGIAGTNGPQPSWGSLKSGDNQSQSLRSFILREGGPRRCHPAVLYLINYVTDRLY